MITNDELGNVLHDTVHLIVYAHAYAESLKQQLAESGSSSNTKSIDKFMKECMEFQDKFYRDADFLRYPESERGAQYALERHGRVVTARQIRSEALEKIRHISALSRQISLQPDSNKKAEEELEKVRGLAGEAHQFMQDYFDPKIRTFGFLELFSRLKYKHAWHSTLAPTMRLKSENQSYDSSDVKAAIKFRLRGNPRIEGYPHLFGSLLQNLVLNASQNGARTIRISAQTAERHPTLGVPHVVLRVSDDGPGIPTENLKRIFEPNFSTRPGGKGRGLASAKDTCKNHGGHIRVESRTGHGTTFEVRIPIQFIGKRLARKE